MVSRAAIDFSSSWFDWFVRNRPTNGRYLKAGADGTLSWAAVAAAGSGPANTYYLSDYAGDLQACIDDAKGRCAFIDEDVTITTGVTLSGATYDNTHITGLGRGSATVTVDGNITGLLVSAKGVTVDNFTIDHSNGGLAAIGLEIGAPGGSAAQSQCWTVRDLEVKNFNSTNGCAIRLTNNNWFGLMDNVRCSDGHTNGLKIDDDGTPSGDNGQWLFQRCQFAGGTAAVAMGISGSPSYHRIEFNSCSVGTSGTAQFYALGGLLFNNCDFEGSPVTVNSLGVMFNACRFSYSGAAGTCIDVDDWLNGAGVIFDGCGFYLAAGWTRCNAEGHAVEFRNCYGSTGGVNGSFSDTNATYVTDTCFMPYNKVDGHATYGGEFIHNFSGQGLAVRYYSQAAQPTLTTNGEVAIWHDTDDGKIYIVARGNGGDKAHELP